MVIGYHYFAKSTTGKLCVLPLVPGRGSTAGRRAFFFFCGGAAAVLYSHAMGRIAPHAGAGSTFSTSKKVPKDAKGLRPLAPPCIKKLCVKPWGLPPNPQILSKTEDVVSEGRLLRSRTKPNQARLLPFWLCCSVPFLCYFCGYFGCRGGVNPPAALCEIGPWGALVSSPAS